MSKAPNSNVAGKSIVKIPSNIREMAKAVILQAVEDLWSKQHQKSSIRFFTGLGYKLYRPLAGIRLSSMDVGF